MFYVARVCLLRRRGSKDEENRAAPLAERAGDSLKSHAVTAPANLQTASPSSKRLSSWLWKCEAAKVFLHCGIYMLESLRCDISSSCKWRLRPTPLPFNFPQFFSHKQCFLPDGCLAGFDFFFFFHILFEICRCRLPRRLLTSLSCITAMLSPPNAGLQSPIGSVGTGQQTASSLPSSTPIDPSSMKRAYAALGLPYSNQSPTQTQSPAQTQGPGQPTAQTPHQQQMRPINALGKRLITLL